MSMKTIMGTNEKGERVKTPCPAWFLTRMTFSGRCLRFSCLNKSKCDSCFKFSEYKESSDA